VKTDYDTENRTSEIQKLKPNRTTEKTEISVRFGFRFMVKKCPPLALCMSPPRAPLWTSLENVLNRVLIDGLFLSKKAAEARGLKYWLVLALIPI
jgi:hypothetical protein